MNSFTVEDTTEDQGNAFKYFHKSLGFQVVIFSLFPKTVSIVIILSSVWEDKL